MDKNQWLEFFKGAGRPVVTALVDYTLANLDKLDFGKRNFLIKSLIRLVLGQLQTQLISGKPIDWTRLLSILKLFRQ